VLARFLRSWLKRDKAMSLNPNIAEYDIFLQNPLELELLISLVVVVWLTPQQVIGAKIVLNGCQEFNGLTSVGVELDQEWISESEAKIGLARIGSVILGTMFLPIFFLIVFNKLYHALANNLVWIATCIWMSVMLAWTITYR